MKQLIRQKSYEHINHILRPHPMIFIKRIVFFVILIMMSVLLFVGIQSFFPTLMTLSGMRQVVTIIGSIYLLSLLLFFLSSFNERYLDIWVITNDRIIDIVQNGLFSRTISEFDLYRIQDVTTEVKGFFATILDYGNVYVKTASTNVDIVFEKVPNPNFIRDELIRLSHEDRKFHNIQAS